jgi:hypothetical protein
MEGTGKESAHRFRGVPRYALLCGPGPQIIFHLSGVLAQKLYIDGQADIVTICRTLGISRSPLYRALRSTSP